MNHGMYIRIQVPPPLDPDLDTEIAIGIARDLAAEEEPDRDAVAARCRSRASHVSLRQIGTNIQEIDSRWDPRVPLPDNLLGQVQRPRLPAQPHRCEFAPGHEDVYDVSLLKQISLSAKRKEKSCTLPFGTSTTPEGPDAWKVDQRDFKIFLTTGVQTFCRFAR